MSAQGSPYASGPPPKCGDRAPKGAMRTVRAQAAERHQVTAQLAAGVKSDDDWAKRPVRVRWTETVTSPPTSTLKATSSGWVVGGMAAFGVAAGSYAAWAGMRLVLNRRRYARWDAEWDLVEPQWSARFGR